MSIVRRVDHVLRLCVMSRIKPLRVGVRELRQNLSVYLRRVRETGEAYEVTERGQPVARLTPLEERPQSLLDRLIAEGRATASTRDLLEIEPLPADGGRPLSEVLVEMRKEERW